MAASSRRLGPFGRVDGVRVSIDCARLLLLSSHESIDFNPYAETEGCKVLRRRRCF